MPGLAAFWAKFADYGTRAGIRLNSPVSVGISARLLVSFTAVAVLAATANIIVQQSAEVTRITHFELGLTSPAALPRVKKAPDADPVAAAQRFDDAALRYQRAVMLRVSSDSPESRAEARDATERLAEFGGDAGTLLAIGAKSLRIADSRRALIAEYAARAGNMDSRIRSSLNGAWKIFGRVLARESLMQLQGNLDELRRSCIALSARGDDESIQSVIAGEAAFSATFNANLHSFERSEGARWVEQMQTDLQRLTELRAALVSADRDAHEGLDSLLRWRGASLRAPPDRAAALAKSAPRAPDVPLAAAPSAETVTTTREGADSAVRQTVAWITGGVLLIFFAISWLTVRSILAPVSRMLDATERVANGDVDVRVPRGGIKELDTLGVSFNHMAEQLATAKELARDYQQHLEEKVDQRTRQLQHLAEHDPLTGLPNRRQLFVLLNHALQRAEQHRRYVGILFVDIDNFKNLNDSLGHAFGDRVLTNVGRRLTDLAQSTGFAGRLGGDEFTVVCEDVVSEEAIEEAGRKLVDLFKQPLLIDGREVVVRASVGASLYPNHGSQALDLLSAADAALFRAKALGRGQLAMFTPELLETANRKFTIEQGLRSAIERGEFELVFQPEVSLDTLNVALVEALVRWRLPDGRQAPPGEFLAITEESGLIIEVGNWVMRKAIETVAHWHHGEWPEARIAINVSPRQLVDQRFAANVQSLLAEFRVPPHCIELELTESVLQTGPSTLETLRRLRAQDIGIALDDFGTGYSSLASLENLPFTRIKLDRSLIASIDTNARAAAITSALIELCHALQLDMTIEGVERVGQFCALAEHRSITLQGYLLSRPLPADAVLQTRNVIPALMQDLLLSVPAASLEALQCVHEQLPPSPRAGRDQRRTASRQSSRRGTNA